MLEERLLAAGEMSENDESRQLSLSDNLQLGCDWWRAGHVTTLLVSDWSLSGSLGLFQSPVLFMIPISASDTSAPCRRASRAPNEGFIILKAPTTVSRHEKMGYGKDC